MTWSDTQNKTRFVAEYPINASPKILFPYLSTASGLARWFCDDVRYVDGFFNFIWDREDHFAELVAQRQNKFVRFVFLDARRQPVADAASLEFALDYSDVTDEVYLRVVDYSVTANVEEQQEMWDGLLYKLREQVGG